MHTIRIWDLPTRVFHWALTLCVIGLIITGNVGGNAMVWHMRLGYAVLALLLFRLVWGLVGGHWSRFRHFLYGPSALLGYLRGQAPVSHQAGHSPLGALAVWAILMALALQAGAGLMTDDEIAFFGPLVRFVSGDTVATATWFHKNVGKLLVFGVVALHLLAIAWYRFGRRRVIVMPMVTGDKQLPSAVPASRDDGYSRWGAVLVMIVCGGAVAALVRWGSAF